MPSNSGSFPGSLVTVASESPSPMRVQSPPRTAEKLAFGSVGLRKGVFRAGRLPKVTRDLWLCFGLKGAGTSPAVFFLSLRRAGSDEAMQPMALSMLDSRTMYPVQ